MIHRTTTTVFCLLFALAASAASADDGAPARQLKALVEAEKYQQAYELGRANASSLGDPLFDFYYGVAALNAGAPGEGTLALERYLMHFPDNRSARFHLARGYYIMGEDLRAREEFASLLKDSPNAQADTLQDYLDAIRVRASRYTPSGSFHAEFAVGRDSNINGGRSPGGVPGLPTLSIAEGKIQAAQSDNFAQLGVGANGIYPVAPGVGLYGGVTAQSRVHAASNNDQFNYQQFGLQGGLHVLDGRHLYRGGVDLTSVRLYDQNYARVAALVGEWQYQADQFNRWGLGAGLGTIDYEDILLYANLDKSGSPQLSNSKMRDSRLWNLSATWQRNFEHPWAPVWTNRLYWGQENNLRDHPELSKNLWGVKTGVVVKPASRWTLAADLSYQRDVYQDAYMAGMVARDDNVTMLEASASYRLTREVSLSGHVYASDRKSTIGLYETQRNAYWLKLRYDMR